MKIENNKILAVTYKLNIKENGATITVEDATADQPMIFIFGNGSVPPKFEEQILGKELNDTFSFMLAKKDAYGEYNEDAIVPDMPISVFTDEEGKVEEGLLEVGSYIPMMDEESNPLHGMVVEVNGEFDNPDSTVKIDFNHPLAGKDLYFENGKIILLRDATEAEVKQGFPQELNEDDEE